jgi:hypothetical protein
MVALSSARLSLYLSVPLVLGVVLAGAFFQGGCSAPPPQVPEPRYQTPPLPDWEPPATEDSAFDPSQLEGEWLEESPPEDPEDEKSLDFGAGGAQNSSTAAPDHATVRPPKSD